MPILYVGTIEDASGNEPDDRAIIYGTDDLAIEVTVDYHHAKELADNIAHAVNAHDPLNDLARNVAGFDDRLLASADLNLLRATLREFRDQARAAIAKATGATS